MHWTEKCFIKLLPLSRKNKNSLFFLLPGPATTLLFFYHTPPVAGKIAVSGKQVDIECVQSRGDGVAGYTIYRKGTDSQWVRAGTVQQDWGRQSVHFVDSIHYNADYYYA